MGHDYYTDDKGTLVLMALLKEYGIKKVVASPGTGNMALVVSMQHDPYLKCIHVLMKGLLLIWLVA